MAVVFTPDQSGDSATNVALAGGWYLVAGTLTFSGSYATGGETLNIVKLIAQASRARQVIVHGNFRGNDAEYDLTNSKLKLFSAANTELAAAAYNAAITASPIRVGFLVKAA